MLPVVIPLLRDIVEQEADYFSRAARLPDPLRNRVLSNRSRHVSQILDIVRILVEPPRPRTVLPRANFTIDLTADLMRTFHEPVPVVPTPAQIAAAVDLNADPPPNEMCAICQEGLAARCTRLSNCGHHFHQACITQWFGTSVRCPVCRNDIRGEDEEEE
jgi:hypothetical protein